MGLIKAVASAVGSGLADQWLEVIEADNMGGGTVFTAGVPVRKGQGSNTKGSGNIISDGSVIHVKPEQFMFLLDGGKVVDYTAEEGYYTVQNSSAPSLFNGQFKDALKETFARIKFGGVTPQAQQVFFVNLQEIKGIKFGTPSPLNYFDAFYNAELFVKAHGEYSIKVTNPLLFYEQVIPKNAEHVEINEINDQYLSEFLQGFSAALNQMSAEGERISFLASKGPELAKHMQSALDEDWNTSRGFEVDHVGVASISYTDDSMKLINMRNQGAMMSDPSIREGYLQSAVAQGLQSAGANTAGAGAAFMGMGMGMNAAGSFMGTASSTNMQQMQMNAQQAAGAQAGTGSAASAQVGQAGAGENTAGAATWYCPNCGHQNNGNFCPGCGTPRPRM
ncbi:MAG: SPFH domain-containing protein [Eubacteriales bacterium]|nr:SPFH domain-containing protein [Eubacteriales bacterium]